MKPKLQKATAGCFAALMTLCSALGAAGANTTSAKQLDVNDVAILWPVPKTTDDVSKLIAADEKLADGNTAIWPAPVFKKVLETAQGVTVAGSSGPNRQIRFGSNKAAFESIANWKIAGIRIDPSAPGCSDKIIGLFGSKPQIRLIVQPVTFNGQKVIVHDLTAHLVFDFITGTAPPTAEGLPPRSIPDRDRFGAMLEKLAELKAELLAAGIATNGALTVHPALKANNAEFSEKLRALLKAHLTADRLNSVAFMGIDFVEPWVFFAMAKRDGEFVRVAHPSFAPAQVQMLSFRGGDKVMPHPTNSTFGKGVGVSTARLFEAGLDLGAPATSGTVPPGLPAVAFRDVPDIIANPQISHFFNTDCLSCHTETTRRVILGLQSQASSFQFQHPAGASGVSDDVLAKNDWNVRNFGWFPDFRKGGVAVESVTMRTANEAAESAAFINREYLGSATKPAVTNALTLVMTIKSPQDRTKLKELITKLQSLPPDKNPIAVALTKLGNVHFARFVFIGEDKLAVITSYDDDFETYILSFVDEIGGIFDQLLPHMKDAPPLPVKQNPEKFLEYVKKNDLTCEQPFFSAYPTLKVQDILTLQNKAAK